MKKAVSHEIYVKHFVQPLHGNEFRMRDGLFMAILKKVFGKMVVVMKYQFNDGKHGPNPNVAYGITNKRDCVTRAIAIATEIPYDEIAKQIDYLADEVHYDGSDSQHGVHKGLTKEFLTKLGWKWTPTMGIGTGCRVHLRDGELPMGRLIVQVSRHMVAVIDGVIHDRYDCSREGTRCVYGYWSKP